MADLVEKIRYHIAIRGGPAKDDDGKYIGTTWPMMLEAADEIERLRGILEEIATFTSDPVAEHAAREALSLPQAHQLVEK